MIEVAERYIYPVKSMAGYQVPDERALKIGTHGVEGSRRWMIIDDEGKPVTARQIGMQTLLAVHPTPVPTKEDGFIFSHITANTPVENTFEGPLHDLELFQDKMRGQECSSKGTLWVQDYLSRKDVHLVHFNERAGRTVHKDKAWKGNDPRAFVDGAQITLYSHDTAADLQTRWPGYDADPRRVRPDFVVRGTEPFEEFEWARNKTRLQIGSVILEAQRPMDRCLMTRYHPDTLEPSKVFMQMITEELKMDIPDPNAAPASCFAIGLRVVQQGYIHSQAKVQVLG